MHIRIDTEAVRDIAFELDKQLDSLSDGIQKIRLLLYDTADVWQGDAQKAFVIRILAIGESYLEIERSIRELSEMLKEQAAEYENAENEAASLIAC